MDTKDCKKIEDESAQQAVGGYEMPEDGQGLPTMICENCGKKGVGHWMPGYIRLICNYCGHITDE